MQPAKYLIKRGIEMDREIELMRRRAGILMEAPKAQYVQMFKGLHPEDFRFAETTIVDWARQTLKREDRVVWYLRLARLAINASRIEELSKDQSPPAEIVQQRTILQKLQDRWINDLVQKGMTREGIMASITAISRPSAKTTLTHHMSMMDSIHTLNNLVWGKQSYDELVRSMETIEKQWAEEMGDDDQRLPPTDENEDYEEPELLIKFPDGFAWWNLKTSSCSAEGNAMGHCGNTAADRSYEEVLSLRRRVNYRGKFFDVPFATFILDTRMNYLGEMKGRANKKPSEKYHPYIVALLKLPLIKGIRGGGYNPRENFHLMDLDPEVREALLEEKPELAGFSYRVKNMGRTEEAFDAAIEELRQFDVPTSDLKFISPEKIQVAADEDVDNYLSDDSNIGKLYALYKGIIEEEDDETTTDRIAMYTELFAQASPKLIRDMLEYAGYEPNGPEARYIGTGVQNAFFSNLVLKDDRLTLLIQSASSQMNGQDVPVLHKTKGYLREFLKRAIPYTISVGSNRAGYIEMQDDEELERFNAFITWGELEDLMESLTDGDEDYPDGLSLRSLQSQNNYGYEWVHAEESDSRRYGTSFYELDNILDHDISDETAAFIDKLNQYMKTNRGKLPIGFVKAQEISKWDIPKLLRTIEDILSRRLSPKDDTDGMDDLVDLARKKNTDELADMLRRAGVNT